MGCQRWCYRKSSNTFSEHKKGSCAISRSSMFVLEVISRDEMLLALNGTVCCLLVGLAWIVCFTQLYVSWQKPTVQHCSQSGKPIFMFITYIFEYLSRHALFISNASGKCAFDLNTQAKSKKCAGSCVAKLRMKSKSSEAQDS